jgi:replicative DNA helicase
LDKWTGGIPSHAFAVVSAFSGIGKSTLLKAFAFNMYAQGYTPLYVTLEESDDEVLHKFDSMAANLTYQHINQLRLGSDALNDWRATAKRIRENVNDIPVIDDIRNCTPDHIFAETIRHKPDVVIVDYVQLMHSSRASQKGAALWQRITDVTQDLKQNARTLGVPIIAAAQTNRQGGKEGAELDNIGGSISVVQDADMLIGLFADDEMKDDNEMEIRLNKNRRGRLGRFKAIWDHDKQEYREQESVDVWTRKKREQDGESKAPKDKRNPFIRKDDEEKKAA